MKKLVTTIALAVSLVSVAPARAFQPPPQCYPGTPCKQDPAPVPEPSSFLQLAAGLFVLGGLGLIARKRSTKSEVA